MNNRMIQSFVDEVTKIAAVAPGQAGKWLLGLNKPTAALAALGITGGAVGLHQGEKALRRYQLGTAIEEQQGQ